MIMSRLQKAIVIALIITLSSCAGLQLSDAERTFEDGLSLYNAGRYSDASDYFSKAIAADAKFGKAHLYLGMSYLKLGRFRDAIQPLRTAFSLEPEQSQKEITNLLLNALLGAGLESLKKGNHLDALEMYREAFKLDPQLKRGRSDFVAALVAAGTLFLAKGDGTSALSLYQEALKLSPDNIDAYIGIAKAFAKKGDIGEALQTILDAMKIHPGNEALQDLYMDLLPD